MSAPFPDAIFVPLPIPDVEERLAGVTVPGTVLPIAVYGALHMLHWPTGETEQKTLLALRR